MLTTPELENTDAVSENERILVASHKEANERIAELEKALIGQSVRIATTTDV